MKTKFLPRPQRGVTIVETLAGMTILAAALGGAAVLMLSYQLQNVRNEIKSGGVAAAEQVMDQLRQCNVTILPSSGSTTIPANTPTRSPCGTLIPALTYSGDKYYSAQISYCQNSSYCDSSTRHIQVEIFYDQTNVFRAETVYTALQ